MLALVEADLVRGAGVAGAWPPRRKRRDARNYSRSHGGTSVRLVVSPAKETFVGPVVSSRFFYVRRTPRISCEGRAGR